MLFKEKNPPRKFKVGDGSIVISDCGAIKLEPDEMMTFVTEKGSEYDIVRKSWGFYATSSLNGRLLASGLKAYLVKGNDKYFVWAVEDGKGKEFEAYLNSEKHKIICELYDSESLARLDCEQEKCVCGSSNFVLEHTYNKPPEGEIRFDFSSSGKYLRKLLRCASCGHFISRHEMDDSSLYGGEYVDANYKNADGMRKTFEKIINLPPEKSDNKGRVKAVLDFAKFSFSNNFKPSVLDVGSGLCVFLYELSKQGWNCLALDTDERQAEHAHNIAKVDSFCGSIETIEGSTKFDIIAFNRVLEHVENPVSMLKSAKPHLNDNGFIYVELPDGECAIEESPKREEFFIDHPHVFSFASASAMISKAGFKIIKAERLRDPSGKYTIRFFIK